MRRLVLPALALLLAAAGPEMEPVKAVMPQRLTVAPGAALPIQASSDLSRAQPGITRAVVIFHGLLRNAGDYYTEGLKTLAKGGATADSTLLIAPQFLETIDLAPHGTAAETLAWGHNAWSGGEPARQPQPISSYAAIDALLAALADRARFPALEQLVLAGHSAGGQMVQRYAAVGRATPAGLAVRYVVANPSSYVYFTPDRPVAVNTAACPGWNDWKYGLAGAVPAYVQGDAATLERRYAARDVTYLLGGADIDPNHRLLDRSCEGAAQGPFRLARGRAYFAMMQARQGRTLNQRLFEIAGVPHNEARMFQSACGLAALLDTKGCRNGP